MRLCISRGVALVVMTLILGSFMAPVSLAHHGWGWASDKQFEISGKITNVKLGNPHGVVTIDVQGTRWLVEVGQPWRNQNAGLTDAMFSVGRVMTVRGLRSAKESERLVKAERVIFDGKTYDLYPDRKS